MQLIYMIDQIFKEDSKGSQQLWLRPFEIIATTPGCGIIEFLDDTMSIDYMKRKMVQRGGGTGSLLEYYETNFGVRGSKEFLKA